jgi:hypothetical protein
VTAATESVWLDNALVHQYLLAPVTATSAKPIGRRLDWWSRFQR